MLAGIGNAAKNGMIIRSGAALERLSRIRRAAFDKTGTLTLGRASVVDTVCFDDSLGESGVTRLGASVEKFSEHPLGKAVCRAWDGPLSPVTDFAVLAGRGVAGSIQGSAVRAGNGEWLRSEGVDLSAAGDWTEKALASGATVIYLAVDGKLAGAFALADTLRDDAASTVEKLKRSGVIPMLLTGDNARAAETIAGKTGIAEVLPDLLPEDKMAVIRKYAGGDEPICMIGDGVNDALALTTADAGIAMGGIGSDIAIESADAVLASDDIKRIPYLFRLTKKVMEKIRVNIIAAMIINVTAVVLSAAGILTPVTGALWHNCGSVFVVVNAALLLRYKDE